MNQATRRQMMEAIGTAMDSGAPFSWVNNEPGRGTHARDVQRGVYLRFTQETFGYYLARQADQRAMRAALYARSPGLVDPIGV